MCSTAHEVKIETEMYLLLSLHLGSIQLTNPDSVSQQNQFQIHLANQTAF